MTSNKTKYRVGTYSYHQLKGTVELPRYQRRLVWSKKDKAEFIQTLHRRFPFGSILVYKYRDNTGERITLIDGLQRYTTIDEYVNNASNFIDTFDEEQKILDLADINNLPPATVEKYRRDIKQGIKFLIKDKENLSNSLFLYNYLSGISFPFISANAIQDLVPLQDTIKRKITEYIDLDTLEIPYIEFLGSESELAEVFENLNRGGRKLSKYQVFAAQWSHHEFSIGEFHYSNKMLESIITRYENLNESRQIEITDFDAEVMRENRLINLSEFGYALGLQILENCPAIWNTNTIKTNPESFEDLSNEIGYSTLAITMMISNKNLSEISTNIGLFNNEGSEKFIEDYLSAVIAIYKEIDEVFSSYFKLPGIGNNFLKNGGTNFQLLSFFAILWKIKYEPITSGNININPRYHSEFDNVKSNLISHFINDSIKNYWSGSGDSKLDNILFGNDNKYFEKISRDNMEIILLTWFDESMKRQSLNFDDISKIIYTIASKDKQEDFYGKRIDFEAVINRTYISKYYKEYELPMGTLGNLIFWDKNKKRRKDQISLYGTIKNSLDLNEDNLIKNFYPTVSEINSISNDLATKKFDHLRKLLDARGKEIITDALKVLY